MPTISTPVFCILMLEGHSSVDISFVVGINNINDTRLIIKGVDEMIVALAETIEERPARKLFGP